MSAKGFGWSPPPHYIKSFIPQPAFIHRHTTVRNTLHIVYVCMNTFVYEHGV